MILRLIPRFSLGISGLLSIASIALFTAAPSQAQVIFSDDFNSNTPLLNGVPTGWSNANSGTFDIIGICGGGGPLFDFFPGNGCYIDLDGSTFASGKLKKSFPLIGGVTYDLEFDLASGQSNNVYVAFGDANFLYALGNEPFSKRTLSFTPASSGTYDLTFQDQGGDNGGGILDNVKITQTPGPFPIMGIAAAFGASRRLRNRIRKSPL